MEIDAVTKLLAIEEIKALKARYFRCVDTRDWATLRSLFTDDCHFDFTGASARAIAYPSADAFVDAIKVSLAGALTVHHGHMPEIELITSRTATAIWAMFDIVRRPADSALPSIQGFGHYHEKYRHDGTRWQISQVRLTRLVVSVIEALPMDSAP